MGSSPTLATNKNKEETIQELVDFVKIKPTSLSSEDANLTIEGVVAVPKTEFRTQKGQRIIVKIKVEDFV